jgi:hypothetical protein
MRSRNDELREAVQQFHRAHPAVWTLFCEFTQDRIARGFTHYSAKAVMERIRWETDQSGDADWKINNNFASFYGRRWMKLHPEHDGFFRTRKQVSEDQPARGLRELRRVDWEARV